MYKQIIIITILFLGLINLVASEVKAVTDVDYHDHVNYPDNQPSKLTARGKIMYYNPGVMEKTWAYRHNVEKYPECPECVGMIATMRDGDKKRKLCIQRDGIDQPEGPFYIIDVANEIHKDLLAQKDWLVDIGWPIAEAWNMNRPIMGTLLECPVDHSPILLNSKGENINVEPSTVIYNTNFRDAPSLYANKIGLIPINSKVKVVGTNSNKDWLKVDYNSKTGWIAYFLVQNKPADIPVLADEDYNDDTNSVAATVKYNSYLRAGPSTNYSVVGYIFRNTTIEIKKSALSRTDGWYQLVNGKWISANLVTLQSN